MASKIIWTFDPHLKRHFISQNIKVSGTRKDTNNARPMLTHFLQ